MLPSNPKLGGFEIHLHLCYQVAHGSMYGIFTYIWLICMVNVGKYTIHGWYGLGHLKEADKDFVLQDPS